MNCCITELRNKEVISAKNGCRLGFVCDVEIDTCSGCLTAIVIWGKSRCFGLMGREEDIKICWKDIEVIGEDTVIVCAEACCNQKGGGKRAKRNFWEGMFG